MGIIGYTGTANFLVTDEKTLKIIKTRNDNDCGMCGKKIIKGQYCLGGDWSKFCLDCSPKVWGNFKEEMKRVSEFIEIQEEKLKVNKEKYEKNNLICLI